MMQYRTILRLLVCITIPSLLSNCTSDDITDDDPGFDNTIIESLSGQITFLDEPPASLELNALVADSTLFVFVERLDYTLTTDLDTDLSLPGDYFPNGTPSEEQTWEALNPGTIPTGTKVHSIYLHYDNETYNDTFNVENYINCIGQYQVNAEIRFRFPIIGIIMRAGGKEDANLRESDFELGLSEVDYCEHYFSHFPGINVVDGCQSDRFVLSEDRKSLMITNNTDIHHDNYRVILNAE